MKLTGEKILPLPQAKVWEALNDPDVLRRSIPGCESFEPVSENAFRATVASKIGPVNARFQGTVRLHNMNPPHGYTLSGEGSGGAAGSAKGSADVRLEPVPEGTRLSWAADAQVTGKLAQIGSRLIESTANMMAGQFFSRFEQILAGERVEEKPLPAAALLPSWLRLAGWGLLLALIVLLYILLG